MTELEVQQTDRKDFNRQTDSINVVDVKWKGTDVFRQGQQDLIDTQEVLDRTR